MILSLATIAVAADVSLTFTVANGTASATDCAITAMSTTDLGLIPPVLVKHSLGMLVMGDSTTDWPSNGVAVGVAMIVGSSDYPGSCEAGYIVTNSVEGLGVLDNPGKGTVTCTIPPATNSKTNWGFTLNVKATEAA